MIIPIQVKNLENEIFQFRQIKQRQDETNHQLYIQVKEHTTKCGYENKLEQEIKQKIILTTNSMISKTLH